MPDTKPYHKTTQLRTYLAIFMVALAISLVLSPPTVAQRAIGANQGERRAGNPAALTIEIASHLNQDSVIGLAAVDLDSGKRFNLGEDREFDAASTMKILFAVELYKAAAAGRIDLDSVYTIPTGSIQRYGTGSIQHEAGPYKYTWRELVKRMMQQSDNTAAYVISHEIGIPELQAVADSYGMDRTDVEKNTTTAADMGRLMEKLYRAELLDVTTTQELLILMRNTQFEDRLPALLPGGTTVSHKTGDAFDGGQHDVGVVEGGNHRYLVAILTSRTDVRQVAAISKALYGYYHP